MSSILSLPAELGAVVLKFAVAKYIEGAGSAAGAMTSRAAALKAIATDIAQVATGAMTVAELQKATAAALAAKNISISTQIAVNGLLNVLSVVPVGPSAGLISAAIGADVNLFAQDVISVCTAYGA